MFSVRRHSDSLVSVGFVRRKSCFLEEIMFLGGNKLGFLSSVVAEAIFESRNLKNTTSTGLFCCNYYNCKCCSDTS